MQPVTQQPPTASAVPPAAHHQPNGVASVAQATLAQSPQPAKTHTGRNWLQIFGQSTLVIGKIAMAIIALIGLLLGGLAALCAALI